MRRLPMVALLVALQIAPAGAEPLERLFSTPHLAGVEAGHVISYRHVRASTVAGLARGAIDEAVLLERGDATSQTTVTLDPEGSSRQLAEFRGTTGNPILMVFLESTVRAMSEATDGSPFYLRNRIKEAMRERMSEEAMTATSGGAGLPAHMISLRPFEGDPNVERMGPFAALELRFVMAEDAPGMFLSLTATTEDAGEGTTPAFFEEFVLDDPQ